MTPCLHRWQAGDSHAEELLMEAVYAQLRARVRGKRLGGKERITMEQATLTATVEHEGSPEQLVNLDRALTQLAVQDERKGSLMEIAYFGGLEPAEAAAVLNVSTRTIQREMQFAKLWLKTAMRGQSRSAVRNFPSAAFRSGYDDLCCNR